MDSRDRERKLSFTPILAIKKDVFGVSEFLLMKRVYPGCFIFLELALYRSLEIILVLGWLLVFGSLFWLFEAIYMLYKVFRVFFFWNIVENGCFFVWNITTWNFNGHRSLDDRSSIFFLRFMHFEPTRPEHKGLFPFFFPSQKNLPIRIDLYWFFSFLFFNFII